MLYVLIYNADITFCDDEILDRLKSSLESDMVKYDEVISDSDYLVDLLNECNNQPEGKIEPDMHRKVENCLVEGVAKTVKDAKDCLKKVRLKEEIIKKLDPNYKSEIPKQWYED